MSGDSSSAQSNHDSMFLTSSGDHFTDTPALPRRDGVLVNKGAAAPKSCLSPVEMRTLTAAGGLLPAGTASTSMRTIFPRSPFSRSIGKETNKTNSQTNKQLPSPCWRRVIETKSRKTLVFDPGGSTGRLRACPFLGWWRTLLCGRFWFERRTVLEAGAFLVDGGPGT